PTNPRPDTRRDFHNSYDQTSSDQLSLNYQVLEKCHKSINRQLDGLPDAAIVHRALPIYSFMPNVTQLAGDETMDLNASQFQAELALLRPQTDGAIVWGADPSSYSTTSPASWWIGMQNFAAEDANVPVPASPWNLQIDP